MGAAPDDKTRRAVEMDPRFPSGRWVGFWDQREWGSQQMSLSLSFINGHLQGSGRDMVGRFDFAGTYDLESGRVHMVKHYERAHPWATDYGSGAYGPSAEFAAASTAGPKGRKIPRNAACGLLRNCPLTPPAVG